jgi:hypothetical protein
MAAHHELDQRHDDLCAGDFVGVDGMHSGWLHRLLRRARN